MSKGIAIGENRRIGEVSERCRLTDVKQRGVYKPKKWNAFPEFRKILTVCRIQQDFKELHF
jgi:hypothetical protein